MSNIDAAIEVLLRKHRTCDTDCPELWLVSELKKHRQALQKVLKDSYLMSTTDIKSLAKDLAIEV